jgi:outer membrane receptor protein involved in Fe transport
MFRKIIFTVIIAGLACSVSYAQEQRDLNKEVKVKTAYQPKINKSKRIGELPVVQDTATFTPSFTYFIQTKPLAVGFSPALIPAARIVGEPLQSINSHVLTLAGGNYSTLFGDYRFNNQRSKTTDFGIHIRHYSTNGKLTLENDNKVKPDWTEQLAEVYGSTYLDEAKISGRVYYSHKGYNFFGSQLKEDLPANNVNLFPYSEQDQNRFGFATELQTTFKDEEKLNFGVGLQFEHFSDDIYVAENDLLMSAEAKLRRGDGLWSLSSSFDYFATDGLYNWSDQGNTWERKTLVWNLNPQYSLQTGKLNLKLGLNTVVAMGDDSKAKIYPDVAIDLEAIDGIMTLFAGVDGNLNMNNYNNIIAENPFVYSGLDVKPSNQKYRLFGGVKGSLSSNSSFKLSAEYSSVDDQYFFVQRNAGAANAFYSGPTYSNKFDVVYDDISLFRLGAEVTVGWTDKLQLNSAVWYNKYTLDKQAEAWHKPEFEMNVNATYAFTDELEFQAGVTMLGERAVSTGSQVKTLDAVYDLNIGANYRLNKHFTAFGKVNNLFADKYYQWDGYPSQRLNFLLGVKVVF